MTNIVASLFRIQCRSATVITRDAIAAKILFKEFLADIASGNNQNGSLFLAGCVNRLLPGGICRHALN